MHEGNTQHAVMTSLPRIAVFAALIAVLGLPGTGVFAGNVPVTVQTLGVMLAGTVLGARRGTCAVLVFLALTVIGLPLLAGGRGGLGVLLAPSCGYLLAWLLSSCIIGIICRVRAREPRW